MKRWLAISALLGGLTYLTLNLAIELAFPDHWAGSPDRLLGMGYAGWNRMLLIPNALLLIGLAGVYRHLAHAIRKFGKAAYWLSAASFGLIILGLIIEFWVYGLFLVPFVGEFSTGSTGSQIGYSVTSFGGLSLIISLLLFGFACLRAPLPARWRFTPLGIGIIYASILYFFFAEILVIHALLYGLSWMTIGYFLWRDIVGTK